MRTLGILLLLWFACGMAQAQTKWYANGSLGSDSFDGTSGTVGSFPIGPKATMQAAVDAAAPGDSVFANAGTYVENITISSKNIIFATIGGSVNVKSIAFLGTSVPKLKLTMSLNTLSINGTFASAAQWNFDGNWVFDGTNFRCNRNSSSSGNPLTSTVGLVSGRKYNLTYAQVRTSSFGGVRPSIGGTAGTQRNASGTYTETITAGSSSPLAFIAVAQFGFNFTGNLDNIVLEEQVENYAQIIADSVYLNQGNGDAISECLRMAKTAGKVKLNAGSYALTSPIILSRACTLEGQDTLNPANGGQRVILTSSTTRDMILVGASNVIVKGLEIRLKSTGTTTTNPGTNTENSCIAVNGLYTGVQIINNYLRSDNGVGSANGIGLKALVNGSVLLARSNYVTCKDTSNPLNGGFLNHGIWYENNRGSIVQNRALFNAIQDIVVRNSNGAIVVQNNFVSGYGLELNGMNAGGATALVKGNTFRQPVGQPQVLYGGVVSKGGSSQLITIQGNTFSGYQFPALQLFGQSNVVVDANTFTPPNTGTFVAMQATTCINLTLPCPGGSSANVSLTIKSNDFKAPASVNGTAINLVREVGTGVFTAINLGGLGIENYFRENLGKYINLDSTTGRPVTNNIAGANNYYTFGGTDKQPAAFTIAEQIAAEDKTNHYMDGGGTGFVTLNTNTAVVTGTGNNKYLQRGADYLSDGGTLVVKALSTSYPQLLVTKGLNLNTDAAGASTIKLVLNAPAKLLSFNNGFRTRDSLKLFEGKLLTGSDTLFHLAAGPGTLVYSNGYVVGPLKRRLANGANYAFPIGSSTARRTVSLYPYSRTGLMEAATASYVEANPLTSPTASTFGGFLDTATNIYAIASSHYHTINPDKGSAIYKLAIENATLSGEDAYTIAKRPFGSTIWQKDGRSRKPNPKANWQFADGTLVRDSLSGFSDFATAFGSNNPVPVSMIAYSGGMAGPGQGWLAWQVAKEQNVLGYNLLELRNGKFEQRAHVVAKGLAAYKATIAFAQVAKQHTLYIEAVDRDGSKERFGPIVIEEHKQLTNRRDFFRLFPSPFADRLVLVAEEGCQSVSIFAADGRLMMQQSLVGQVSMILDTSQFPAGVYIAVVQSANGALQSETLWK